MHHYEHEQSHIRIISAIHVTSFWCLLFALLLTRNGDWKWFRKLSLENDDFSGNFVFPLGTCYLTFLSELVTFKPILVFLNRGATP